jgi:ACS family allantoate permease-like MFS transporter
LGRAYSGIIIYTVALIGCILVITLPSHNKIGLLFSYWTSSEYHPAFMTIIDI